MKVLDASPSSVKECAGILSRSGSVVLLPTETVYGLVCRYDDVAGADRIYALKRRPKSKLLAAFLPSWEYAEKYVKCPIPEAAKKIAGKFCPGPVTLVIPDGAGSTFGFRVPDHKFVLALLREMKTSLASTSANLSGTPAALSTKEALSSIDGEPDAVVEGGMIPAGSIASTVIMVNGDNSWKILRPGPVTEKDVTEALKD